MSVHICIIGSGAGAAPVAYTLSNAGYKVTILEKGPFLKEKDFSKDEILACRKSVYTPNLKKEQHVLETPNGKGKWKAQSTFDSGRDFWNGNMVGGSSNLMSGYFHRLKPNDFNLLSTYGPIQGANIADWPINYSDLEPYYAKVEEIVGVSGKVVKHPQLAPRSTANFPYPPLKENLIAKKIDAASQTLGYHSFPTPRAIISERKPGRSSCYYSNYCGSYGCSSGAKGSARAALLQPALTNGNLTIIPHAKVFNLVTNASGKVTAALYYDVDGSQQTITASHFVVACQAIETSRLLLASAGGLHPNGIGNNNGQLGKNIVFSAGGVGHADFDFDQFSSEEANEIDERGTFVNRSLQDWYEINDPEFGPMAKGGTVDFLWKHANPIARSIRLKWENNNLIWGANLQEKMQKYFTQQRHLTFEVFNDWLPTDNCFVTLDPEVKDQWGDAVARIRLGYHEHDIKVGKYISAKAEKVFEQMGGKNIRWSVSGSPPANLVAGGCRFGNNPETSVLDKNCKVHDCENLYVTDASFMPTGGSVPYTFTIYANAFRVADIMLKELNATDNSRPNA